MEKQAREADPELLDLRPEDILEEAEAALPILTLLVIAICSWHHNKQMIVVVLFWVPRVNHEIVLGHDAQLGHQCILHLSLYDKGKRVAHDCNEHVQEDDVDEEAGEDEEKVDEQRCRMIIKAFTWCRAQSEQILVVDRVKQEVVRQTINDRSVLFLAAHLEDIHGGANHAERRDKEDHELLDVDKCCNDQLVVEGC